MRKWRVGTISMGILLIATGFLLILSELRGYNGAVLILRWWPVILIILGLEILAYLAFSKEDQPRIRLDGLSILLTILIILISAGVYGVNSFLKSDFATVFLGEIGYYKNQTIINRSYAIDAGQVNKLQIENSNGQIRVEKYDGQTIKVDAGVLIKNNDEEAAQQIAKDLIEINEGPTLSIFTRDIGLLQGTANYQVTVNYAIKVPKGLEFTINNKNGEIILKNLGGNVQAWAKYGRIEAENIQGDVQLENLFGEIKLQDISGKIEVYNKNGEIFLSNRQVAEEDIILCANQGGSIRVELPGDQQGYFRASAEYGEISMEGFASELEISREETKQYLEGVIGSNVPNINLQTGSGDIILEGILIPE
ncbi:MAG TPA: DUF4097 domain-containing protein [Peptococcaceae bacterium]|nr:DUF4097 domain-containing protein [Peptococcaceae bacterium]